MSVAWKCRDCELPPERHRWNARYGVYECPEDRSAAISHARRSLEIIRRMALVGVGPDTSPEVALQTIATFSQKRLEALEEVVRRA